MSLEGYLSDVARDIDAGAFGTQSLFFSYHKLSNVTPMISYPTSSP